jgi:hypothetical protein
MAGAVPHDHFPSGKPVQVIAEIAVGGKYDFLIPGNAFNNLHRICRGTADIGHRLNLCGCIDIGDYNMIGVHFPEFSEFFRWTGICKRAAGIPVGYKHLLFRRKYLGCLCHEIDPGKNYNIRIGIGRFSR